MDDGYVVPDDSGIVEPPDDEETQPGVTWDQASLDAAQEAIAGEVLMDGSIAGGEVIPVGDRAWLPRGSTAGEVTLTSSVRYDVPPVEPRRVAKVRLDPQTLRALLGFPEGVTVNHIYSQYDPFGIAVVVEGPMFEPIPDNQEAPWVDGHWDTRRVYVDDEVFIRWGWQLDGQ